MKTYGRKMHDGVGIPIVLAATEIANLTLRDGRYRAIDEAGLRRIDELLAELDDDPISVFRVPKSAIERDLAELREWLFEIARRQTITRAQAAEVSKAFTNANPSTSVEFEPIAPSGRSRASRGIVVPYTRWRVTGMRALTAIAVLTLLDPLRDTADRLYSCRYTKCRCFGLDLRHDRVRGTSRFYVNCPKTATKVNGSANHTNAANQEKDRVGDLQERPAPWTNDRSDANT